MFTNFVPSFDYAKSSQRAFICVQESFFLFFSSSKCQSKEEEKVKIQAWIDMQIGLHKLLKRWELFLDTNEGMTAFVKRVFLLNFERFTLIFKLKTFSKKLSSKDSVGWKSFQGSWHCCYLFKFNYVSQRRRERGENYKLKVLWPTTTLQFPTDLLIALYSHDSLTSQHFWALTKAFTHYFHRTVRFFP